MTTIPTLTDSAAPVGTLWLTIDDQGPGGRGRAVEQHHQGALRVIRPHYLDNSGQVSYTLVSVGGGYLGGDVYDQRFRVLDRAQALLTTQSATKIYRTPQGPARQFTEIEVGKEAVLEYLTDPTIAYREATYHQFTRVRLDPSSTFVLSEGVTPGWHPDGSQFTYDEVRLHTEVVDATTGRTFLLDNLVLRPEQRPGHFGWTEKYSHSGQLLVVAPRVDQELVAELTGLVAENSRVYGAASLLGAPGTELRGLLLRTLSHRTEDLVELQEQITSLLRKRWRNQPPVNLRKY